MSCLPGGKRRGNHLSPLPGRPVAVGSAGASAPRRLGRRGPRRQGRRCPDDTRTSANRTLFASRSRQLALAGSRVFFATQFHAGAGTSSAHQGRIVKTTTHQARRRAVLSEPAGSYAQEPPHELFPKISLCSLTTAQLRSIFLLSATTHL